MTARAAASICGVTSGSEVVNPTDVVASQSKRGNLDVLSGFDKICWHVFSIFLWRVANVFFVRAVRSLRLLIVSDRAAPRVEGVFMIGVTLR